MRQSNQKLFLAIFILSVGIALFIEGYFLIEPETIEIQTKSENSLSAQISEASLIKIQPAEDKTVTIILTGDIMLNRGVEYLVKKQGEGDFRFPFFKIADVFKKADVLFGNLEGPISDKGVKVGSIYSFRAEPEAIEGLIFAGFDIMSLANNHAFDYGREALEDTFLRLEESGINFVGAGFNESETYSPVIMEVNDSTGSPQAKIAFLAYTNLGSPNWQAADDSSGIAWLSEEKLKEGIKSAREKADIVIVSFHLGEEYQTEPNQDQEYFSRLAIDYGADLVIGHHPHVVQKNEIRNPPADGADRTGYIFYSLGNFVFDQSFSKETMESQVVKVLIEDKKIKEVIPVNIKINEFFQPEIENYGKI